MEINLKIIDLWDKCFLSHKWVIGDTLSMIRRCDVSNIDEWREFYYKSGDIRNEKMHRHPNKHILSRLDVTTNDIVFNQLPSDIKKFNYFHGRTKNDINSIVLEFEKYLEKQKVTGGHEYIYDLVDTMIFGRSWGIYEIEKNVIKTLKDGFNSFDFIPSRIKVLNEKTKVAYEIYENKQLICGLDIISSNFFKTDGEEFVLFRKKLLMKHSEYEKRYKRKSYVILTNNRGTRFSKKIKLSEYFNDDGTIKSKKIISELLNTIK